MIGPLEQQARLRRLFEEAGIDVVYGVADGWHVDHEVPSDAATILASAHRRVHGSGAAAHLGGGRFVVGDPYAPSAEPLVVESMRDLDDLAPHLFAMLTSSPMPRIEIDGRFDPERQTSESAQERSPLPPSWSAPEDELLDRVHAAERPMLIAGPGVVAAGMVADLHALATSADLGVINTWGAKGLFDWRSRHHWATVGLQAGDLELAGVPESDLVVLTGIDPDELDTAYLEGRPTVEVPPAMLGPLAEQWTRPRGDGAMPELRARLAAVTQQGWARTEAPWAPSRVTRDYAEAFGGGGFVAADPGIAGYWVARTFATTRLGGAKVPARRAERGSAIASVIVARLRSPRARALAVTDELSALDHVLLDAAHRLGVPVQVELWSPVGKTWEAGSHAAELRDIVSAGSTTTTIATDPGQLDAMVEAAGPITAWDGLVPELVAGAGGDEP